ncbi:MAG: hypothetical protein PF542_06190 [Nanoarchaeota archaeon]|jgi:hypothetical protein|nr:hypothetical protein [Nanoarchaeota archaeon]
MNSERTKNKISREKQIIRWATFVKNNPKDWQEQHTSFINSQIINANEKYEKLKKMPNGKTIIHNLRKLRFRKKLLSDHLL